jgi:hypothetical protein
MKRCSIHTHRHTFVLVLDLVRVVVIEKPGTKSIYYEYWLGQPVGDNWYEE